MLSGVLSVIEKRIKAPSWMLLANLPKGRFMDVGCGAGLTVNKARQLGWDAMGIEVDPAAVQVAKLAGLNVVEATYEQLMCYPQQFDCIICSHVLEHVYEPRDLLAKIKVAIKPGGLLLISLPNSLSALRRYFGANWRGLEAPRHLSLPSEQQLIKLLLELGFSVRSVPDSGTETAEESYRIQRRDTVKNHDDIVMARQLVSRLVATPSGNDLISLICETVVIEEV
jgi:2-polyprenyl-3-methyl-5-hydroxy-6-metoxy-1,4-benzoquinol methylase